MVDQMNAAQRPTVGLALAVDLLSDLERMLDWCEVQVLVQEQRFVDAR